MALSQRGLGIKAHLDTPWRYPLATVYDAKANPDGVIAFSTAENNLVTRELEQFAENIRMPAESFKYNYSAAGGTHFPKVLAAHLNELLQPVRPIAGEEILVADTATALNEILAFSLAEAGEAMLTSRPVYGRYELDFGMKAGVRILYADTTAAASFAPGAISAFEAAIERYAAEGTKVRAVLIVNPHNPLGRCYQRETLVEMMKFCERHQIHLISDEIFAGSVFDSGEPEVVPFTSILSIDPDGLIDPQRIHVLYGMSKDFGAGGLRIGAIVTRNQPLRRASQAQLQFTDPAGPSIVLSTAMLEDREWCRSFLDMSRQRLATAFRHAADGLGRMGVRYLPGSNAGFFIWLDLSPYLPPEASGTQQEREFALAQKLVDNSVYLHPGEEHSMDPGWFRMIFTHPPEVVTEGLKRLEKAISS